MNAFPLWAVRATAGALSLVGVAAMAFGAVLVVQDESSHSDDWDGLGTFFGLLCAVPGLVLVAVTALTWWLSRRDVRAAALVLCVLGAVLAALGMLFVAGTGVMVSGAVTVVGLLVTGVGLAAAQAAAPASVDSPGGSPR